MAPPPHLMYDTLIYIYKYDNNFMSSTSFRKLSKQTLDIYKKILYTTNKNNFLVLASLDGNLKIIKKLHQMGADIKFNYNQPLCLASENGHLDIVHYLYENGVDLTYGCNKAMQLASKFGHLNIVQYIHKNSINNEKFRMVGIPQICIVNATNNGHQDIVDYINQNIKTMEGVLRFPEIDHTRFAEIFKKKS